MGTPGMHTYMNRAEQAHAMLDGARAARNLSGGNGKVAFYGHSQGGGASAAAVEEAANYAPDLQVAAAYASAPPADLEAVQRNIDGSDLVGAIGFTINGLAARYPQLAPIMIVSGACTVSPIPGGSGEIPIPGPPRTAIRPGRRSWPSNNNGASTTILSLNHR